MATSAQIPVEEYLKTVYRPDCDYVDGVVEERNLGEFDHSFIQAKLIALLMVQGRKEGILPIPEWRFQIKPTRFRVPDVIVIAGKPGEQIRQNLHYSALKFCRPKMSFAGQSAHTRVFSFRRSCCVADRSG